MTPNALPTAPLKALASSITAVQVVDIVLHAATHQLEPIRVASNGLILLWLALLARGSMRTKFRLTALGAIGLYLALNLIFLAQAGLTNAAQGGGLRVTLFLLVFLTSAGSAWLAFGPWQHPPK